METAPGILKIPETAKTDAVLASVSVQIKSLRSIFSRAGAEIARKINVPPSSTSGISGYMDQPTKRILPRVKHSRNSISGIKAPRARNAPPKI